MKKKILESLRELRDLNHLTSLTNLDDSSRYKEVFGQIESVVELQDEILVSISNHLGIRTITVWRREEEPHD